MHEDHSSSPRNTELSAVLAAFDDPVGMVPGPDPVAWERSHTDVGDHHPDNAQDTLTLEYHSPNQQRVTVTTIGSSSRVAVLTIARQQLVTEWLRQQPGMLTSDDDVSSALTEISELAPTASNQSVNISGTDVTAQQLIKDTARVIITSTDPPLLISGEWTPAFTLQR